MSWRARSWAIALSSGPVALATSSASIGILDRDAEQDPARGTGSALGVGDEAQFRVTDGEADIKGPGRRRAAGMPV